jgi:NTE family protein
VAGRSAAPSGTTPRPRIGLALSGGGARGFAHVGVLRALEALRIPVDCIAGTSAGSAVGAAYASGLSPDEIEWALRSADWDRDMFDDSPPRRDQQPRRRSEEKAFLLDLTVGVRDGALVVPPGLISGQKIELFLHRMLGSSSLLSSFDQLPIPFRAIATDLVKGEMVVQGQGSLVTAVRASMAVPSAFAPVQSGDLLLVDGGLTRNMPVDVVRALCGDVVIAVDIGGPLLKREDLGNALGVAGQMVNILMERNMRDSRAEVRPGRDVLIQPDLGDIGSASFSRGVEGIPAGEAATRAVAAELARLTLAPAEYAGWQAARAARVSRDDRYAGVRVRGASPAVASGLIAQSGLDKAQRLDRPQLERTINFWNSSGDFDRIGYSLIPGEDGQTLELDIVERGWGPNFVRFGISAAADSNANGMFNVMLGYRRPNITAWGGEFKTQGQFGSTRRMTLEMFQPINQGRARFFLDPQMLFEEVPIWVFSGRDRVAEYGARTVQAGLDLGVQGSLGEVRLGAFGGMRASSPRTGSPVLPDLRADYWGGQLSLVADQLDATDFPRDGFLLGLTLRGEQVLPEDGGTPYSTRRAQLVGKQVFSVGNHTVAGAFRIGEASDQVSLNQAFSLGGFMNLSGMQLNQLLGTSLRHVSLSYQNQILTLPNPLGRGVYAGLAIEGGRMGGLLTGEPDTDWSGGATAFLGAHTGIGPVYVGYGYAQGGNRLFYLFLGRPGL